MYKWTHCIHLYTQAYNYVFYLSGTGQTWLMILASIPSSLSALTAIRVPVSEPSKATGTILIDHSVQRVIASSPEAHRAKRVSHVSEKDDLLFNFISCWKKNPAHHEGKKMECHNITLWGSLDTSSGTWYYNPQATMFMYVAIQGSTTDDGPIFCSI